MGSVAEAADFIYFINYEMWLAHLADIMTQDDMIRWFNVHRKLTEKCQFNLAQGAELKCRNKRKLKKERKVK